MNSVWIAIKDAWAWFSVTICIVTQTRNGIKWIFPQCYGVRYDLLWPVGLFRPRMNGLTFPDCVLKEGLNESYMMASFSPLAKLQLTFPRGPQTARLASLEGNPPSISWKKTTWHSLNTMDFTSCGWGEKFGRKPQHSSLHPPLYPSEDEMYLVVDLCGKGTSLWL